MVWVWMDVSLGRWKLSCERYRVGVKDLDLGQIGRRKGESERDRGAFYALLEQCEIGLMGLLFGG